MSGNYTTRFLLCIFEAKQTGTQNLSYKRRIGSVGRTKTTQAHAMAVTRQLP